jgi:acyl-CoA thioesterase I
LRPAQDPVIPLLIGGLVAVAIVATLSFVVWIWAIRRPAPPPEEADGSSALSGERPPLIYAAVGSQIGFGLDNDDLGGRNWAALLREKLPEGTRLLTFGRRGVSLAELNIVEIPAAIAAKPDIVTLWNVVTDATKRIALSDYIRELNRALISLGRGTNAIILLLNLPDISLLTQDMPGDRQALIRGGVEQWNRAIADATAKFGKRVFIVDLFPWSEELLLRQESGASNNALPDSDRNALLADLAWQTLETQGLLEAL